MDNNTNKNKHISVHCLVGIGASAGGIEALQQFLTFLPSDTGMAFVIIQHLAPDHKSLLPEILSKYTSMPVREASDNMPIEPNSIYLIPPKYNLEVYGSVLRLQDFDHDKINHPIDIFFRSLAMEYQNHAVAVIMSGTGSDGSNGIKAIREQNGVIIVQAPESAKFDGMPRSAIATGFEDMILNPDSIAREMEHIAKSMNSGSKVIQATDEDLMSQIFAILKSDTNVNYSFYKQTTILRRIERRMVVTHTRSLNEYVSYLKKNAEEAHVLSKEVLIGVTSFFRDPDYFEVLKAKVIIPLISGCSSADQIRVWVAGCSTGEEAYSIAILFSEAMEEMQVRRDVKIFATDLDSDSIMFASRGIYSDNIIEDVSISRLSRYFSRRGSKYAINPDIRRMIVFAQHNVFQDPPFGKLDLISCRNLMIYFQNVLQKNLFAIFHLALKDKGYLFLGKSESVGDFDDIFRVYSASEKIYVHNASGRMPSHTKLNYTLQSVTQPAVVTGPTYHDRSNEIQYSVDDLQTKVLESLLPATILVDDENSLKHIYGDCSDFLMIPVGAVTYNLFSLIIDDLRIAVSKALKETRASHKAVTYDQIPVTLNGKDQFITLTATPIDDNSRNRTNVYALSFIRGFGRVTGIPQHFDINSAAAERITDLENELKQSQANLKHTVSELESVNAELQAANEELMTANEELQSSNEELQSVNEELYTVNSEYQAKVAELASVNDDMANFLSTTLVGIVMVDNELNIRKYTEYIASEFNVADQDVGRSLRYIAYNFPSIDLIKMSEEVQKTKKAVEHIVTSQEGKSYLIRIAPYRPHHYYGSVDGYSANGRMSDQEREDARKIDGLVITFIDTKQNIK